jgi:hypothetical protein
MGCFDDAIDDRWPGIRLPRTAHLSGSRPIRSSGPPSVRVHGPTVTAVQQRARSGGMEVDPADKGPEATVEVSV